MKILPMMFIGMWCGFMSNNQKRNRERDKRILRQIRAIQLEIQEELKFLGIYHQDDLSTIRPLSRRGLVHAVGDIFERIKELTAETQKVLKFEKDLIKDFRNKVFHNYGAVDNFSVFVWVDYCVRKDIINSVEGVLKEIIASEGDKNGY